MFVFVFGAHCAYGIDLVWLWRCGMLSPTKAVVCWILIKMISASHGGQSSSIVRSAKVNAQIWDS